MTEVWFCGWFGETADKVPVMTYPDTGSLCCPWCGRVDALEGLPVNARSALLREALQRRILNGIVVGVAA